MAETDAELQLRVWKELAISKQVLMRAATDALKLDPNCTQQELKEALEATLKRSADAELNVSKAQEQAKLAIAGVEKQLAETKKSLASVEATLAETLASQEKLQQQLANERNNHALEAKKLKDTLAEKERALKSITTILSDTPENVAKKMKALKKQKMDEADARKKAEDALANLRKEKTKLEQSLKELQAAQEKSESDENKAA